MISYRILPPERSSARRMKFRIGVHVGEVIVDDDDIFGDTVNIAVRLQEIGDPGGIAVSAAARDAAHRHIDAPLVELGPKDLKNIAEPVSVWRVDMGDVEQDGLRSAAARPKQDRAAIAVLPFDNMSNDPEQEYLADGLVEDLITALSLLREMRVISRNSAFAYKGKSQDVRLVASELDARYALVGSVRKAGNRVRITAQLIDAATDQPIWTERFDREMTSIFELQDEIISNIAGRIAPTLRQTEIKRLDTRGTDDLDVWGMYHRMVYHLTLGTAEHWPRGMALCEEIKARAPDFAPAYTYSSSFLMFGAMHGFADPSADLWRQALDDAERAVSLSGDDYNAHANLTYVYAFTGNWDDALKHGRRAHDLNPYSPRALFALGVGHWINGQHKEACECYEEAWRRGPADPERYHWAAMAAYAYFSRKRYDAALSWANQCLALNPTHRPALACRAVAMAKTGRQDDAAMAMEIFLASQPHLTSDRYVKHFHWRQNEDVTHFREALELAGMPRSNS